MIKASELRIGNKFLSSFGNIETVCSIIENTNKGKIKVWHDAPANVAHFVSENHREMYSHLILCWENGNQYKPFEIKGIRLTEEKIIKYGFSFLKRKSGTQGVYTNGKMNLCISNNSNVYRANILLPYVHTLQNLYFALTTQELNANNE